MAPTAPLSDFERLLKFAFSSIPPQSSRIRPDNCYDRTSRSFPVKRQIRQVRYKRYRLKTNTGPLKLDREVGSLIDPTRRVWLIEVFPSPTEYYSARFKFLGKMA